VNVTLPRLGFGSASITPETGVTLEQAVDVVQYAYAQAIRFFDTAPHYGAYSAESRIGLALRGIPRADYLLETKVGRLIQADGTRVFDFSRAGILKSLEGSLKRLNTDYVDGLLLHDPIGYAQQVIDEAYPLLVDLKAQGVVRWIGVGVKDYTLLCALAQQRAFDVFMQAGHYTLLEQEAYDALNVYAQHGVTVIAAKVYQSGILATGTVEGARYNYGPAPQSIVMRVRGIEQICAQYCVPLRAAALQFVLAHPSIQGAVIGMQSRTHVEDALAMLSDTVPAAFWQALRDAGYLQAGLPTP